MCDSYLDACTSLSCHSFAISNKLVFAEAEAEAEKAKYHHSDSHFAGGRVPSFDGSRRFSTQAN